MGKKEKFDKEKDVDEGDEETFEDLDKKFEDFMKKYDKPIKIKKIKPSDIKKF